MIDDFISGDESPDSYSLSDQLVEGMQRRFGSEMPEEEMDTDIQRTIMLTVAFLAPRLFVRSVRPDLTTREVARASSRSKGACQGAIILIGTGKFGPDMRQSVAAEMPSHGRECMRRDTSRVIEQ